MITVTGILTDAGGNPLPKAIIELRSRGNIGEALIHAVARDKTGNDGRYSFGLKSGEYDVYAQINHRSDVELLGVAIIGPDVTGEVTLEEIMAFTETIPHESVIENRALTQEVRDKHADIDVWQQQVSNDKGSAELAATNSADSESKALTYKNEAAQARDAAQAAEATINTKADEVAANALVASQKSDEATASAVSSASSAATATGKAGEASTSALAASQKADEASFSAATAIEKANEASDAFDNLNVTVETVVNEAPPTASLNKTSRTLHFQIPTGFSGNKLVQMGDLADDQCVIDFSDEGSIFTFRLTQPNTTVSLQGTEKISDIAAQAILMIEQGTGANKIDTWPASIRWANGRPPVLSYQAGDVDVVGLLTCDNGATWLGFYCSGRY